MKKKILLASLLLTSYSCGSLNKKSTKTKTRYKIAGMESMRHVETAPSVIKKAGEAVVRINANGTGFFITENGLLMTNNHVLGVDNCPKKGV